MQRNDIVIPFNKSKMTLGEVERAVSALEAIIVRWQSIEDKRAAQEEERGVVENYDEMTDEFFWDVRAQIEPFSTWKIEEEKKDD